MIIEQRRYVAKPGHLQTFFALQEVRGYTLVKPILERLIGYFESADDTVEDILHLWRYDDFSDWIARLHGLYHVPELEDYFRTVRPILAAQDNKFLEPAPSPELCPLWNVSTDWTPASGGPFFPYRPGHLVNVAVFQLAPGGLGAFWRSALAALPSRPAASQLIGTFSTLIGRQHEVTLVSLYPDALLHDDAAARSDAAEFNHRLGQDGSALDLLSRWYRPAGIPQLSPLFSFAASG